MSANVLEMQVIKLYGQLLSVAKSGIQNPVLFIMHAHSHSYFALGVLAYAQVANFHWKGIFNKRVFIRRLRSLSIRNVWPREQNQPRNESSHNCFVSCLPAQKLRYTFSFFFLLRLSRHFFHDLIYFVLACWQYTELCSCTVMLAELRIF